MGCSRFASRMQLLWIAITTIVLLTLAACTPASTTKNEDNVGAGMLMSRANDTLEPLWSATATSLAARNADMPSTPAGLETTLTLEPSSKSTLAADFSLFADSWIRYTSEEYGISFEYPAVYDVSPYQENNCGVKVSTFPDGVYIDVGMRISLAIIEAGSSTLMEYVDNYLKDREAREFILTSRTDTTVGGVEAIMLEYRFGGTNRYGTATFFRHGDRIFGLNFTAGVFCESIVVEDTQSGMTELGAYFHILESFEFTPP